MLLDGAVLEQVVPSAKGWFLVFEITPRLETELRASLAKE